MTNQSTKKQNSVITKLEQQTNQVYENEIDLNDNARIVLEKRYLRKDADGNII